jgi:hypothetical protein
MPDFEFSPAQEWGHEQDLGRPGPEWGSFAQHMAQQVPQTSSVFPVWEPPASSVSTVLSGAAAKVPPAAPVTGVMKCPYTVHNDGSCWKLTVQQKGDYYTAAVPGPVSYSCT